MTKKETDSNAKTAVYGGGGKDIGISRPIGIVLPPGASFPQRSDTEKPQNVSGNATFDQKTVPVSGSGPKSSDEARTTVFRQPKPSKFRQVDDPMDDPVAGWLVVIEGPGRGHVCKVGYGFNTIGREAPARIVLNFGDTNISRESHAAIIYERQTRTFFLAHTTGVNLTYRNGELVIAQVKLSAGDVISLGRATALRFIPLCDEAFDWENTNYGQE
jgi:hypothetical protein